ncbi:hypothetical protein SAMN02910289_00194 [Lachnospiraceae bacterium RM5]|nr:hypothetical protein SAMN02910289_00194 [Lachnospiraceae bacterium RM5]
MDKILIELYIPASDKLYELKIPRHLKVIQVKRMIINYLGKQSESEYIPGEDAVLCDYVTGKIIKLDTFIEEAGWFDGYKVFLVG